LKLDPTNTDAVKELQKLERERKVHERDYANAQKKTWTRVFGGKTEGYDEPDKEEVPLSAVRQCSDTSRHLTASAVGVGLSKVKGQVVLEDLNLELRRGWCVGLHADAKHTREGISKLFSQVSSPSRGSVEFHRNEHRSGIKFETPKITTLTLQATTVAVLLLIIGLVRSPIPWWVSLAGALYLVLGFAIFAGAYWDYQDNCSWGFVMDPDTVAAVPDGTVEQVVSATMPKVVKRNERRGRVAAMLRAATDGSEEQRIKLDSRFSDLPQDHKQVVYILRCIAKRSPVLVCNEPLKGLDSKWHPRIFRMLKRMKKDLNTCIVYLSTDMLQLRVMSDSLGMISGGIVHELGPACEVLVAARSEEMKAHLEKDDTGENAESMNKQLQGLLTDKSLNELWLPSLRGD